MVEDETIKAGHHTAFCAWIGEDDLGFRLMPEWDLRRMLLKGPDHIRTILFNNGRSAGPDEHSLCLNGLFFREKERHISFWCPSFPPNELACLLGIAHSLYPGWRFTLQPLGHEAFIRELHPNWEGDLYAISLPTTGKEIIRDAGAFAWEGGPGTLYIRKGHDNMEYRIFSESATDLLRRSKTELNALWDSQPVWTMPDDPDRLNCFLVEDGEVIRAYDPNLWPEEWAEASDWHPGLQLCESGWYFFLTDPEYRVTDLEGIMDQARAKTAQWLLNCGEPESPSALACMEQIGS